LYFELRYGSVNDIGQLTMLISDESSRGALTMNYEESDGSSPPTRYKRPGCLTLYIAYLLISAPFVLLTALLGVMSRGGRIYPLIAGTIQLIVNAVVAMGLWRLHNWARIAVIVLHSLLILMFVLLVALAGIASLSGIPATPLTEILYSLGATAVNALIVYWFAKNGHYFDQKAAANG
jgi:hypothetical protein